MNKKNERCIDAYSNMSESLNANAECKNTTVKNIQHMILFR